MADLLKFNNYYIIRHEILKLNKKLLLLIKRYSFVILMNYAKNIFVILQEAYSINKGKAMKKLLLISISLVVLFSGCADQIVSECDDPIPGLSEAKLNTFTGIQEKLFTPTCALAGCHASISAQAGLVLEKGAAYNNLVNVQGQVFTQFVRVEPGDAANSLLIKVLHGDGVSQMPPGGSIDDAVIDSIAMWIDNGALNN